MTRHLQLSILLLTFVLLTGCVSKNSYQQKVNEADLLSRDVAALSAEKEQWQNDKQELEKQLSELNQRLIEILQKNSELQKTLLSSRADQTRQSQTFSRQQAGMQEQLQGLQETNEQLLASIEQLQQERQQLQQQKAELEQLLEKERIAKAARLAKLKSTYDQLVGALEQEIERGELTISNLEGKLSVNLLNRILFDSGKTDIKPAGQKVLRSLGDVLNKFPDKAMQIEGHTDNVQISSRLKERFPTNWELSTARATSIVHFLQDEVGLPGGRLVASGFGEYQPLADNDSEEGRAQNRRIQIVLVPYQPAE